MAKEVLIMERKKSLRKGDFKSNYDAVDYIQTMMLWAKDNISKEEMLEIIKGDEGKVVGVERLQQEVDQLEVMLKRKKRELLKKTMALYFLNMGEKRENMEYAKYE